MRTKPEFRRKFIDYLRYKASRFRFLSSHEALYSSGLPTGISLSATLSELYLRNFDRGIKALPWVRYFARYVDDIIIIAEPRTTAQLMESALISGLPDGLALNSGKDKRYFRKLERDFGGAGPEADFDYLGYRFKVDKILKNQVTAALWLHEKSQSI
ncbi:hypothetical protein HED54_04565 [Ochrobactrum anthropi ATCC 49188]|nr:hypothetical protein [Brucella anthropi ATCC 49188]